MTPEHLALVRATATKVEDSGEAFARRFHGRLSTLHPSAGARFPADPRQEGDFVDEILFLATVAGDLPVFVPRARELGRRQQDAGVQPTDYPLLGEVLLDAVRHVTGADWTPEVAASWQRLFSLVSETMLEGAAGGLFSSPVAGRASPPGRPGG